MSGGGGGGFLAPILKPITDVVGDKLGLTPSLPTSPASVVAPPPSPTSEDPAVAKQAQSAMDNAATAERKARGRASTLLTGGKGIAGGNAASSARTLLGG